MKRFYLYPLLGLLLAGYASSGQGIKIMPGTTFKLTGGNYTLVLANGAHLENNVPITGDNLVIKASGSGTTELKGTGALNVSQVQVSKTAGQQIVLQKNMNVAQSVTFNSGLLDLNGFDLVLAPTALLVNEAGPSRVVGNAGAVQITQSLDAPLAENPGNLGMIITSGANWGSTQIRRSHSNHTNPGGGGSSVGRSYQITPANNTGLNAFLRMYYLDAELNALDENTLEFFRSDDSGVQWYSIGSVSRNTTQNFVNINGVQTMSLFTLSTIGNALPLEFENIRIACVANQVQLQWLYANPLPGAYFRVDKSRDGVTWRNVKDKIVSDPAPGYEYSYTDVAEAYPYYRLQYVTVDGKVAYSPVKEVNCRESGYAFNLLQNPVGNMVKASVQAKDATDMHVRIFDMQGRLMLEQAGRIPAGVSQLNIDVSGVASGMYMLKIGSNTRGTLWQVKFVK